MRRAAVFRSWRVLPAIAAGLACCFVAAQPTAAQLSLPAFFRVDEKPRPKARVRRPARQKAASVVEQVLPVLRPERSEEVERQHGLDAAGRDDGDIAVGETAPPVVPLPTLRKDRPIAQAAESKSRQRQEQASRTAFAIPLPSLAPPHPAVAAPPAPSAAMSNEPTASQDRELNACLAGLRVSGVGFVPVAARADPLGCSAPNPLDVARLPGGLTLVPTATVNCEMAQAVASWTRDVVVPNARKHLQRDLKSLAVGASYVCRNQASGRKLSEHAFANAIDLMGFTFDDGTAIAIGQGSPEGSGERLFVAEIRRRGCNYFNTVLGPGSDADHTDHIHLDLRGRRGGYKVCQ